jgi:antitoxin component HigA of HigAB toxin-antitoxin module
MATVAVSRRRSMHGSEPIRDETGFSAKRIAEAPLLVAQAWVALSNMGLPVEVKPLQTPHDAAELRRAINGLIAVMERGPESDFVPVIKAMMRQLQAYEKCQGEGPKSRPAEILALLMAQHDLTDDDLAADLGSAMAVKCVLNGWRAIGTSQAMELAARFNVAPAIFLCDPARKSQPRGGTSFA